jgi:hypothetical protein
MSSPMRQAPSQALCQRQTTALPHELSWDGGHRPTVIDGHGGWEGS